MYNFDILNLKKKYNVYLNFFKVFKLIEKKSYQS